MSFLLLSLRLSQALFVKNSNSTHSVGLMNQEADVLQGLTFCSPFVGLSLLHPGAWQKVIVIWMIIVI